MHRGKHMHIQDTHWSAATAVAAGGSAMPAVPAVATANGRADGARTTPLRVDAQRNLEHVLRAAREVFGELGYGAPMEDVARRARVGVGTVYRRFPSKDVLVRRIAEEETARLTEQARTALGQEDEPWSALSRFLRTSVASGAGRLLPPQVLRVGSSEGSADAADGVRSVVEEARVPQQRLQPGPVNCGSWGRTPATRRTPVPVNCSRSWGSWWSGRGRPGSCGPMCPSPTCCW